MLYNPFRAPESLPMLTSSKIVKKKKCFPAAKPFIKKITTLPDEQTRALGM